MPPFTHMASTDGIIESCVRGTRETARNAMVTILRQGGLEKLANVRDDKLRAGVPLMMRESPVPFILQQMSEHQKNCGTLLQRVRPELHQAVDEMLEELENDASVENAIKLISSNISTESPRRDDMVLALDTSEPLSQPRAPVAEMDDDPFDDSNNARSFTMMPCEAPLSASSSKPPKKPTAPPPAVDTQNVVHSRTTSPASPQMKRSGPEAGASTPGKRAKTTAANTPSKPSTSNATPKSAGAKGKKAEQQKKKLRDPDDDEYQQSQTQSDAETVQAALQEGRRRELAHRAARAADPNYEDRPLGDNEFVIADDS